MNCLLIIASICFAEASQVEIDPPNTVGRWATTRVNDASVKVVLSSDNLAAFDPKHMNRACKQNVCLSYHKWCNENPGSTTCTYIVAGIPYWDWLQVTAPTRASILEAESRMSLFAGLGQTGAVIPLSEFTVASKERLPAGCLLGRRDQQCEESEFR